MRNYLRVFILLFLVCVILILILKWTAVRRFLVNLRGGSRETASLIRALPFDVIRERSPRDLYDLEKKLTPTQILIPDIAASPRGAPVGKYVRVSVVVEAWDRRSAEELRANQGRLATLILDSLQKFPYRKLETRRGFLELKKTITQRLAFFYGDKIRDISVVQFEIREAKR
ncbi:hypothetical protein [Thermosulfurimonas sp. F29]|uniref:hypothetical protein n=1 Tax=Thermosulfurimonas sp. F29 TaxID=2867247 RepID=UPI001C82AE8B|nr:hypothetical protein [Thermosulfurimonas sp. F29]MBX6422407.1 hypothetical protein [Thermosulfurimonas sp. F29]